MAHASAYIKDNKLHVIGTHKTSQGPIPFACVVMVEEPAPDGPLNLNKQLSPGLEKAVNEASKKAEDIVMRKAELQLIRDTVIRSRAGDQNATALIIEARKSAKAGSERAKKMCAMLAAYIKENPVGKKVVFGADYATQNVMKALRKAVSSGTTFVSGIISLLPSINPKSSNDVAVTLANGLPLQRDALAAVSHSLPSDEARHAFAFGIKNSHNCQSIVALAKQLENPESNEALQIGYAVGLARRIQDVRNSNSPIAKLSTGVAWELGQ